MTSLILPAGHAPVARPAAAPRAWRIGERQAFWLSVFIVVLFAGGWLKPLVGDGETVFESPLIRFMFYPGYCAGLALALRRWRSFAATFWRAPLVWGLVAMALASTAWSIDPQMTERRAIALVLSTAAAAAVAVNLDWRRMTLALASGYAVMTAANFATGLLLPGYGRMKVLFPGAWDGLFIEKNALGAFQGLAAVLAFAAARLDPAHRRLWLGMGALAGLLVLLSTSKTSLVAMTIGLVCLGYVWLLGRGSAAKVVATWFAATAAMALGAVAWLNPTALLMALGKDATLTGRTLIWAAIGRRVAERPTTGYGYGAVFSDTSGHGPIAWVMKELQFRPTHAHDSWLMLWVQLGIGAVALWGVQLAWSWLQAVWTSYARRDADIALPLLTMFTLTNVIESQVLNYNVLDWILYVMLAVRLASPQPD